jgi:putative addiction module component (TIGR02574 family)
MGGSLRKLEEYLLRLPAEVRAHLAELLQESLDEDAIADSWDEEAERRLDAYLAGEIKAVPAEEALAELRARFLGQPSLVSGDSD